MEHQGPIHYKASRGGHAPDQVREPFDEWAGSGMESKTVEYDGQPMPYKKLLGMLWNCTDALPGETCAAAAAPALERAGRGTRVKADRARSQPVVSLTTTHISTNPASAAATVCSGGFRSWASGRRSPAPR